MELKFQHAMFIAGGILALAGLMTSFAISGTVYPEAGIFDSLSHSFLIAFFALFSGVLIGTGAALVADGFLLGVKSTAFQIMLSLAFCALSVLAGTLAILNPSQSTFPAMVAFFGGATSGGAFMLSAAAFALSGAFRGYLEGWEGGKKKEKKD